MREGCGITKDKENAIRLFEDKKVRVLCDNEQEKWYFLIIDVIEVLTGTDRPRKYWIDLKTKLHAEGSQLSEKRTVDNESRRRQNMTAL